MRVILLMIVLTTTASAQVPASFSLGAGVGTGTDNAPVFGGASIRMAVPLGIGSGVVQAGATLMGEPGWRLRPEGVTGVHVAVGAVRRVGPLVVSAAAGPAVARITRLDPDVGSLRVSSVNRPGAYAGAQALAVVGGVGLGMEVSGYATPTFSTAGACLVLAIVR